MNNFDRLGAIEVIPGCPVPGSWVTCREIVTCLIVGDVGSRHVALYIKGTRGGETYTIYSYWLALDESGSPGSMLQIPEYQ